MSDSPDEFRQQLINVQEMSPLLRSAYQKELDAMFQPRLTGRTTLLGTVLAVLLLVTVGLIARADLLYHIRGLTLVSHLALAVAFLWASLLIIRDLRKRTYTKKSVYTIAMILTWASGTMTVIALILGLQHSSDPKTLLGVFYVFVFYFACCMWGLESRIAAAELSAREQSLRIECRLADLAEWLPKS